MKEILKDIFSVISLREKRRFVLLICLNTIINLADVFSLVCLLFIVKFYTQPSVGNNASVFPGNILPAHDSILPVLFLIAMFTIKNIAAHLVYKAQFKFIGNVAVRLSEQNLSGYLNGPYSDYATIDSSVFINKIIYQPIEFTQYVLQGVQQITAELLLVTFSTTALLLYNAKLFLIVFITLLPAIAILSWSNKKKLEAIKNNIKVVAEQSLQYLNEALKGYVESNIYNRNAFFTGRHKDMREKLASYIVGMQTTQDMPPRFFEVFAILGLFVLIVVTKYTTGMGNADVVILGAFMAAAYKIIPSISKIINLAGQVKTFRFTAQGIYLGGAKQDALIPVLNVKSIAFTDVCFSYNGLPVLDGLSFSMDTGTFVGISGDSGTGKTTLMQLLLGFYPPASGSVLFNGVATGDRERIAYWNRIAYVKQEAFILHDSFLNNIVLFDEHPDMPRLNAILEVTGLTDIISRFPEGIHKPIMEAGKNISGGQRQRVAIARALYKDADVILLDEPFSELDEVSELKLLHHFKQLSQAGKMVVLISHSRNGFRFCDKVISL